MNRQQLLSHAIDVHCHIQECLNIPQTLEKLRHICVKELWVMGTSTTDWDTVASLADTSIDTKLVPCFGIHPWFVHKQPHDAMDLLKQRLEKTPLLGEFGLDRVAKDEQGVKYPLDSQLVLFEQQFEVALERGLPMSIHVVKAFGHIQSYLHKQAKTIKKNEYIPPFMLHSFSGSLAVLEQILAIPSFGPRAYFSISHLVNGRMSSEKSQEVIKRIPDDRILIESDMHDPDLVDDAMWNAASLVAAGKEWSLEETIKRTTENARRFLSR